MSGPLPDPERAASAARAGGICHLLQPLASAPLARTTGAVCPGASLVRFKPERSRCYSATRARRAASRVRSCRLTMTDLILAPYNGCCGEPGSCGNASASRRPRSPWLGSWRSSSTACGAMEPTSSGQTRSRQLRGNNPPRIPRERKRCPCRDGGVGEIGPGFAMPHRGKRDSHTLTRQRPPTPSCRGPSPTCGENSEPDRCIRGKLDIQPRVREQPGPEPEVDRVLETISNAAYPSRSPARFM